MVRVKIGVRVMVWHKVLFHVQLERNNCKIPAPVRTLRELMGPLGNYKLQFKMANTRTPKTVQRLHLIYDYYENTTFNNQIDLIIKLISQFRVFGKFMGWISIMDIVWVRGRFGKRTWVRVMVR